MNTFRKSVLATSISAAFLFPAFATTSADDSGIFPEDEAGYCEQNFDPINCGREYFESKPDVYVNPEDEGDCWKYADDAIVVLFSENPKFAKGVHGFGTSKTVSHEVTFVDRDYGSDTKSSFGCALGLETTFETDASRPFTLIRYSVSQTYVDGLVIYINDFDFQGAY